MSITVDVVIKDDRGTNKIKEDCWYNLSPEQVVDNLRNKYGLKNGFGRWLGRMDDIIWKLDKQLGDEVRCLRKVFMEEELNELKRSEKQREVGLARLRNME
jgi:hypothetical protein